MAYKNMFEVLVRINGQSVKEYVHNDSTYVEAKKGSRYSLLLKNNTASRALAIISVDGLDVLKGKPAEETDSGYIIDGYSSLTIKGYRLDDDKVAEFVFDDGHKSYSASVTKTTRNVGVIGVRFFAEKPKPYVPPVVIKEDHHHHHHHYPKPEPKPYDPWYPWQPYKPQPSYWLFYAGNTGGLCRTMYSGGGASTQGLIAGDMKCSSLLSPGVPVQTVDHSYTCDNQSFSEGDVTLGGGGIVTDSCNLLEQERSFTGATNFSGTPTVPDFNLGTSWGDKVEDRITKIPFEKGNLLSEIEVYYSTRQALEKIGISFDSRKKVTETGPLPRAFGTSSYCQPPKNWVQ